MKIKTIGQVLINAACVVCLAQCDSAETSNTGAQPGNTMVSDPSLDANLTNLDAITASLNLRSYRNRGNGKPLKIAILDNGFQGLDLARGTRLPTDVKVQFAPKNAPAPTPHGTRMAEIVYGVATGSTQFHSDVEGPELLLYNTNGYTNFAHAIEQVIANGVDMVLYSQVWEYGGNGAGTGFINQQVNRVTAAGIQWINAAGNFGRTFYEDYVRLLPGGVVKLPHQSQFLRFDVSQDATPTKIVIAWNDFANTPNYRTALDLDAELWDAQGTVLARANLIQDGQLHQAGAQSRHGKHAREILRGHLNAGSYRIRITTKNASLPSSLRVRIAIDGAHITMHDRSVSGSVLIPADNPSVLTVGASDVDYSAVTFGNDRCDSKPEIAVDSLVTFDNGEVHSGTSAAAAIVAGGLAAYQSIVGLFPMNSLKRAICSRRIAVSDHHRRSADGTRFPQLPGRPPDSASYQWAPPILRFPPLLTLQNHRQM